MWRRAILLGASLLMLPGVAAASVQSTSQLAVALANLWQLADDAVLVADARSNRPLLCVSAVHETGDSIATERSAALTCYDRVARWTGPERWVRITGLAERWSADKADQLVVLYAFALSSGPTEPEVQHWLELALAKNRDSKTDRSIEVHRGFDEVRP
jgi:hypothetical protein